MVDCAKTSLVRLIYLIFKQEYIRQTREERKYGSLVKPFNLVLAFYVYFSYLVFKEKLGINFEFL